MTVDTALISKKELIDKLKAISAQGWVQNARHGNDGGVGNTLEDLLGLAENNLPIPNSAEWELKTQRSNTKSLITLAHMEPSPRAARIVPAILLPKYGWPHKEAGKKYPASEMSFRATLNCTSPYARGFYINVNRPEERIEIQFDSKRVTEEFKEWLVFVEGSVGLNNINPVPYWGFDDLFHKIGSKLHNTMLVKAEVKKIEGREYYHYTKLLILRRISKECIVRAVEEGQVLIDFDARTGHNHGTKFRIYEKNLRNLYAEVEEIDL